MKIAVFATGKHMDMNGQVREWTESDLDRIISQYDPATHEAPAVIGHPMHNTPAWGWVTGLTRAGDTLYAEFGQLDPQFLDMLKAGRFKKRSISLYPDLSLKHVGFLGAAPPAVKGLPDYSFKKANVEETIIEFIEKENNKMEFTWNDLKEFIGLTKTIAPEPIAPKKEASDSVISFTEADVEKAKKEAVEAERTRLTLEFAEATAKAKQEARHDAIKAELDQMATSGKVLPAWMKAGLAEFMLCLDAGTEIQFAEGTKQSPLDWFKSFLAGLPKVIEFGEKAKGEGTVTGDASAKLEAMIKKKLADNKALSYSMAFAEVQLENPDLVNEYIN